ncbi:MAG: L,D-transpeptidase, partial [Chloroflexi bacterium]|nr:L,D-transpeptidase [Chloroflexota bacterium]
DLILTRVLVLDGLEPGKNKGGNRDSKTRGIYIHGTNDEEEIGTPTSHGCIRLQNNDVITAFERLATGTLVLITEKEEEPDQDD